VTIPANVTSIGDNAFEGSPSLQCVFFEGNAPTVSTSTILSGDDEATVYYWLGTTDWHASFAALPTAVWQYAPITIATNGDGTFASMSNGQLLQISSINTVTAHPGKGWVLSTGRAICCLHPPTPRSVL